MSIKTKIQAAIKSRTTISEEYKSILTKFVDTEVCETLTPISVCLADGKLDVIFMDRFNGGYVSTQLNLDERITDWSMVKYNFTRYKRVVEAAIVAISKNDVFVYRTADASFCIFNNGADAVVVIPASDIDPIFADVYGTIPPHNAIAKVPTEPTFETLPPIPKISDESGPVATDTKPKYIGDYQLFGTFNITGPITEVLISGGRVNLLSKTDECREGDKRPARNCYTLEPDIAIAMLHNYYHMFTLDVQRIIALSTNKSKLEYIIHKFNTADNRMIGAYVHVSTVNEEGESMEATGFFNEIEFTMLTEIMGEYVVDEHVIKNND